MGSKLILYICAILLCLAIVSAVPAPDFTLYGSVTVNGKTLTQEDSNVISLQMNGKQLASFKMGDVAADAYVLRVPMNTERTDGYAMPGDTATIFIDGTEVNESPVTIGEVGTTVKLDITVETGSQQPLSVCTPNWQCSAWGACSSSGIQTRTCNDLNDCTTNSGEPTISQSCTPTPSVSNGGGSGGSGGSSSTSSHTTESQTTKETITVSDTGETTAQPPKQTETKIEPVVIKSTIASTPDKTVLENKTGTTEETVSLWQRLLNLLGIGKEKETPVTGKTVSEVSQANPLIGILIALVIVVIGLLIAYLIIFREEEY